MSYESGDEDATSSKEHLAGVDPFLGPVLDPFVAVSPPSTVCIHQGLRGAMGEPDDCMVPGSLAETPAISGCFRLLKMPRARSGHG